MYIGIFCKKDVTVIVYVVIYVNNGCISDKANYQYLSFFFVKSN